MTQPASPLEPHRKLIERLATESKSYSQIVAELAAPPIELVTSDRSIRRALRRWGVQKQQGEIPGVKYNGDQAEITGRPSTGFNSYDDLLLERKLDPEEWEVLSLTINEWDGVGGEICRQLKGTFRRKKALTMVTPGRVPGRIIKPDKPKLGKEPRRVVFCGDQQAPYYDKNLHVQFCRFLGDWKPHEGVLIGDTIDLPDISRHPHNPEWHVTTQDCIDSGVEVLYGYRESYEPCQWTKLAGNHDERLRRAVVDRLREIYGIRQGKLPEEEVRPSVVDIEHLLRLDELGIKYIRPDGDYEHMQVNVSPLLAARHGWIARKGSGASALATLEHLGFSVVVGHTHRQSLVHKTRHDINGSLATLAACETGCMCRIQGGLSYAVAPDWQNGFATAEIWPDGTFKLDLATFVNNTLYYRDKRYNK